MGRRKRAPCCDSSQVNKGAWSEEESEKLKEFILQNGHDNWRALPKLAGLKRCGKSCRLRWINYLRPGLKRGGFTKEEEDNIILLHKTIGNRWSKIAAHLPGRTDNEIKNMWNTHLKKRVAKESSSSSEVTNNQAGSSASTGSVSLPSNDATDSKKKTELEEFMDIFGDDMDCGFDLSSPQSLEFLFDDQPILPPPTSEPGSLAVQIPPPPPPTSQPGSQRESVEAGIWSRMLEPGLDDEWLNFLDNYP